MKIYKIVDSFLNDYYIIASNIDNAIKVYKEVDKNKEENVEIKEINFISFCYIGE